MANTFRAILIRLSDWKTFCHIPTVTLWGATRRVLNSVLQHAMSCCLHSASTFGGRLRLQPQNVDAGDYSCRLTCFIGWRFKQAKDRVAAQCQTSIDNLRKRFTRSCRRYINSCYFIADFAKRITFAIRIKSCLKSWKQSDLTHFTTYLSVVFFHDDFLISLAVK